MVECGFDHGTLNAMTEDEFQFWLAGQIELEEARAEARKAAQET